MYPVLCASGGLAVITCQLRALRLHPPSRWWPRNHLLMAPIDTAHTSSLASPTTRGLVFHEILTMGLELLRADKLRATMTALSMAVGTAALILVVTVARTGRSYVLDQT